MQIFRIFILHVQNVLEQRARAFVYFLMSLINPLILILFWKGAVKSSSLHSTGWTFDVILSYYLLLTVASALLSSHIDEDISMIDIKQGQLVSYILRPFSYFWKKFFEEIPFRIMQGIFSFVVCVLFYFFISRHMIVAHDIFTIVGAMVICCLAYLLSFTFKMCIGLSSFWLVDIDGVYDMVEVLIIILGGFILPLSLLPGWLNSIATVLPFSYMIYFPVLGLEGKLGVSQLLLVLLWQGAWICLFGILYQLLWGAGVKKFTGVGQ